MIKAKKPCKEKDNIMKEKKKTQKELVERAIEELKYVKDLNELETKLGVKLTPDLLREINKKLNSMKSKAEKSKRKYSSTGNRQLAAEGKAHIGEISALQEKLSEMKKSAKKEETLAERLDRERVDIIKMLEEMDAWLDEDTYNLFLFYQRLVVHGDRIDIIKKIAYRYMENSQTLLNLENNTTTEMTEQEEQLKSKNRMRRVFSPWSKPALSTREMYEPFENRLQEIINQANKNKTVLELLAKLESIEGEEEKLVEKPEMTSDELMQTRKFIIPTNQTEERYQALLKMLDTDDYDIDDLNDLQDQLSQLLKDMVYLPRYELSELTKIAKSVIGTKRKFLPKGEDNDIKKAFLKEVERNFDSIDPIIFEDEEDTRAYYDILEILMQDDRNFDYIMELLQINEFRRARTQIRKTVGTGRKQTHYIERQHIMLLALDNFIVNYKKKLANQHLPFIEPDFYKEIIKQMIRLQVELTPDELALYNKKLDEFRTKVINRGYQNSQQAIDDINEISNVWQLPPDRKSIMSKHTELSIDESQERIEYGLISGIRENQRKGYQTFSNSNMSRTFLIEGLEPYAFSVEYQPDGSRIIATHVLDTTKIMGWDDSAQESLKKYPELVQMQPGQTYPTFAFQCGIGADNVLYNAAMKSANLEIDEYFTKEDLENYRDFYELKDVKYWVQLLQEKYIIDGDPYHPSDIKKIISTYLSEVVSGRLEQQRIPFIYKSTLPNQDRLIETNHNETCEILSKVPKYQAHQIYRILDSKKIVSTYYVPDKTIDSKIEFDSTTAAGMYLLTTLHRIETGRYNPNEAESEIPVLLEELNSNHQYVPSCLSKHNKSAVAKKARQYRRNTKK